MTRALPNLSGSLIQLIHAVCLAALGAVATGLVQKNDLEKFRTELLTNNTAAPVLKYQSKTQPKGGSK